MNIIDLQWDLTPREERKPPELIALSYRGFIKKEEEKIVRCGSRTHHALRIPHAPSLSALPPP